MGWVLAGLPLLYGTYLLVPLVLLRRRNIRQTTLRREAYYDAAFDSLMARFPAPRSPKVPL